MGCGKANGNKLKYEEKKQGFMVTIIHPQTKQLCMFKYYDEKQKTDLVMNVMNGLCFSEKVSEKCEGNFVSRYEPLDDRFHYHVQKLMGIEVDNQEEPMKGRVWVPYINEKRQDWDMLVENNTRMSINDMLVWKFEVHKKADAHKK